MLRFPNAALVVFVFCLHCAATAVDPNSTNDLMEADRAFARAAAERGIDGWMSFFTEDAARVLGDGRVVVGLEQIRAVDSASFADPEIRLTWDPTDAGLFADGDHGFTKGRFAVVRVEAPDGTPPLSEGAYLSIWRRDAGTWKVILDTSVPE